MSSKKATTKAPAKASASEKKTAKATPKKAPEKAKPAKAAAPAKKPAVKAAPAKKPAAKPAPAKKAAPAKAVPAKATSSKKSVVKKEAPAKTATVSTAAAKKNAVKTVKKETSSKTSSAKKAEAKVETSAKETNAPVKSTAAPKKPVEKKEVAKPQVKVVAEPVNEVSKVDETVEKHDAKKAVMKSDYPYSVLLEGGKKPCKFIMFVEIDEQEERANKKKVTSEMKNLEKKPTSAIRHKISLAEETQEELTERILKELEEQNAAFTREAATQICTRCNKNLVSPEFWVDKHLGYCEECAAILHLGQSKEARKVEYQLGSMGGDSLDEVEDDDIEGPDAAALKEAEEDLAEFDE